MTQRDKVLDLLTEAGPEGVTNGQFAAQRILRFGARIKELRDEGHNITTHGTGTVTYVLQERGGGENPGSSLAEVAPVLTMTVRELDGTWREIPTPGWVQRLQEKATANRWTQETRPKSRESSESQQPADAANESRVSQHPDSLVTSVSEAHSPEAST